ncbi:hypothetical protein QVH35_00095 [Candidatus Nitrosotenuis chungbukensis]|uniref:hypothetical protein n=1 Tax=Candidatus Nitrosotenuis chungbukensis TaxID=1353246 RepID=UPI002671FA8E|nr:hypothetical protein [Candidatus Nitrosotenuis chungbukensis]WKT57994.1 hypothetical protein QVH35_00095 [Candidatus Nitrosotenuis chungbukensis]
MIKSGYVGALKMTILEELVHSIQNNLYEENKKAVIEVNRINEDLAKIILALDDTTVTRLSDYLQLPAVPDEFPIAKRANLFFMLNPDNFIVNVLGPDVMTFTKVEIDPTIQQMVPQILEIYQRWLLPIQRHHAAFSTMEGMAEFSVQNILKDDEDFHQYLMTFMGTDISSYQVRKNMGKDFTEAVFAKHGKETFQILIRNPPTTRELKDPQAVPEKSAIVISDERQVRSVCCRVDFVFLRPKVQPGGKMPQACADTGIPKPEHTGADRKDQPDCKVAKGFAIRCEEPHVFDINAKRVPL